MNRFFKNHSFKILLLWVIFLSITYATLSVVRHNRFESGGFDLGLYDQAVWQYSRFLWPYNTIKDRFILGDHLTLTLPLLAPLFWLWDDVRMLLIFQAVWISFSTIAIYKLTLLRKFSHSTALVMSFLYSMFYGIQYAVFFDFHPVVIGVGLGAWFLYFFESKKKRLVTISLVLMLLTQENMGILLASFGILYRKISFLVLGLGASFLVSKIISLFSPFQYWPQVSTNPIEIAKQFFDQPEKRQVWLYSLSWFSFLPLLSPNTILATLLDLGQYFATGPEFSRMWSPFMHHRITLAPILTLGTLASLRYFGKRMPLILLVVALFSQYYFHLPLNKLSKPAFWKQEQWMVDNQKLLATIQADAKLATQQNLVPHVSHRQYIFLAWPRQHDCKQENLCWWLDFDKNAQFLLVDLHPNQWLTQLLETNEHFGEAMNNMEKANKISLEKSVGSARLYRVN